MLEKCTFLEELVFDGAHSGSVVQSEEVLSKHACTLNDLIASKQ